MKSQELLASKYLLCCSVLQCVAVCLRLDISPVYYLVFSFKSIFFLSKEEETPGRKGTPPPTPTSFETRGLASTRAFFPYSHLLSLD